VKHKKIKFAEILGAIVRIENMLVIVSKKQNTEKENNSRSETYYYLTISRKKTF
jgi:hypothetical protein